MCQNVFRNNEEEQRREMFTKLFVTLAANMVKEQPMPRKEVKK